VIASISSPFDRPQNSRSVTGQTGRSRGDLQTPESVFHQCSAMSDLNMRIPALHGAHRHSNVRRVDYIVVRSTVAKGG
jgi:hypothetical protein